MFNWTQIKEGERNIFQTKLYFLQKGPEHIRSLSDLRLLCVTSCCHFLCACGWRLSDITQLSDKIMARCTFATANVNSCCIPRVISSAVKLRSVIRPQSRSAGTTDSVTVRKYYSLSHGQPVTKTQSRSASTTASVTVRNYYSLSHGQPVIKPQSRSASTTASVTVSRYYRLSHGQKLLQPQSLSAGTTLSHGQKLLQPQSRSAGTTDSITVRNYYSLSHGQPVLQP